MFGVRSRTQCSYQDFGFQTLTLMPADGFFGRKPNGIPVLISETSFPAIDDLLNRLSSPKISSHADHYQFLARLVHLISNNMVPRDNILALFDVLQDCFPRRLLVHFFRSNLVSIRGVWQSLFKQAFKYRVYTTELRRAHQRATTILINIALELHPEWVDRDKEKILFAAVWCGDKTTVKQLLDRGALPTHRETASLDLHQTTVFTIAAESNHADCAELAIQACGLGSHDRASEVEEDSFVRRSTPNMPTLAFVFDDFFSSFFLSIFRYFFFEPHCKYWSPQTPFTSLMSGYLHVFEVMLKAGASVDSVYPDIGKFCGSFYDDMDIPPLGRPSYMDIALYEHKPLFETMLPYSRSLRLTRGGLCMAAQAGKDRLTSYLASVLVVPDTSTVRFLELVLAEQFLHFQKRRFDGLELVDKSGRTARTLIEFGICFNFSDFGTTPLRAVVLTIVRYGLNEDLEFVLETLLRWGACIDSFILALSVTNTGTELLSRLSSLCADVVEQGREALLEAATLGNHEATSLLLSLGIDVQSGEALFEAAKRHDFETISLLLKSGIDVNIELEADDFLEQQTVVSRALRFYSEDGRNDWPQDTVHFLLDHGARFVLRSEDSTCFELLKSLSNSGLAEPLKFALDFKEETEKLTPSQWSEILFAWLEMCSERSDGHEGVTKSLLEHYDHPFQEPILAKAILGKCTVQVAQDLIGLGANVDELSDAPTPLQAAAIYRNLEMVSLLLDKGADVSAPARGCQKDAGTALQAACGWGLGPVREDYEPSVHLIQKLLSYGADVNAPPYGQRSGTALQLVCGWESSTKTLHWKREVVKMLLDHGADVNAPAHGNDGATALQIICAECLDHRESLNLAHELMVLLLDRGADVNARPGLRGSTALQYCASRGRFNDLLVLVQHGADPNGCPQPARHYYTNTQPWTILIHGQIKYRRVWSESESEKKWVLALDMAACRGRLDIVQYLLNIGAISGYLGATGFQGAIDCALEYEHFEIADIIRKHSKKVVEDPSLSIDRIITQYAAACEEETKTGRPEIPIRPTSFGTGPMR